MHMPNRLRIALAVLAIFAANPLRAQSSFGIALGPSLPMGDLASCRWPGIPHHADGAGYPAREIGVVSLRRRIRVERRSCHFHRLDLLSEKGPASRRALSRLVRPSVPLERS